MTRLLAIMAKLRDRGGCPWDREQTLESLRPYLIEECYEVLDAVESGEPGKHCEELGDLLLQIVFQSQIRKEQGRFSFEDVAAGLCEKLVRRHPHVFGNVKADTSGEVLRNWDRIKRHEKAGAPASVLAGVPRHLPALAKAQQVQSRASRVGFDWSAVHDVVAKIEEELGEVKEALRSGAASQIREEIGDLLFAVVNLSRFQKLNAEELLDATVRKFVKRFESIERRVHAQGRQMTDCGLQELDALWEAAKRAERITRRAGRRVPRR